MRQLVHNVAIRILRQYLRYVPFTFGKSLVWSLLGRHRLFANVRSVATSRFGDRYRIQLPDLVQSYIYLFGVWEPAISELLIGGLQRGAVFVDVGANIGYYTCLASRLVGPTGKVYSIEASPSIFQELVANVALNRCRNVFPVNFAAYSESTTVSIFKAPPWNIGASTVVDSRSALYDCVKEGEVAAKPLLDLIPKAELLTARIIKIDVEGAELHVLKGVRDILREFSSNTEWMIEVDPVALESQGGSVEQIVNMFQESGYRVYEVPNRYDAEW
jgi:FkbM family methyltransferase